MTAAVENRLLPLRDFYHHDCDEIETEICCHLFVLQ